jgi:hypothetical protein
VDTPRDVANVSLQEAATGEYIFQEVSPAAVRRMVDFFYTCDYADCKQTALEGLAEEPSVLQWSEDDDGEGVPPLILHARMFALAEMYQVDQLKTLAINKYSGATERGATVQDILASIPEVYQPTTCSTLRKRLITALRSQLGRRSSEWSKTSKEKTSESAANTLLEAVDEHAEGSPDFLKDLLSSYICAPLLGTCYNCSDKDVIKPLESLQQKCGLCGKGGASLLR